MFKGDVRTYCMHTGGRAILVCALLAYITHVMCNVYICMHGIYTYPEESKARSRITKIADGKKYLCGTSSAQGKTDGKSVLMTAGPSRHSGEVE